MAAMVGERGSMLQNSTLFVLLSLFLTALLNLGSPSSRHRRYIYVQSAYLMIHEYDCRNV
jgi:hypothetical protein